MAHLYELRNVVLSYAGQTVLDIPGLDIEQDSILGIVGHNGSGKSTLLRLLAFLEDPDQGEIRFRDLLCSSGDEHLRRRATLLTQTPYLLKRTVYGNVAYGLKVRGIKHREQAVSSALDMVGLPHDLFARRRWHQLSGGERQRVALASRLVLQPDVLLLDEPTSNLDRESTELTRKAMLQAREQWSTNLIVVSHDLDWLSQVSDRTLSMSKGRIEKKI
jgi:tungstate transport system ATP-binding protein